MARASAAIFATTILLIASPASGDLGTAVRRASKSKPEVVPIAPMTSSVVVPLRRMNAHTFAGEDAIFYVGDISIGSPPQHFNVVFDTSSGDVVLPHRACTNTSCLKHRRFSPWESLSSSDVNHDGARVDGRLRLAHGRVKRDVVSLDYTQSDLGSGQLKGVMVRDTLCAGIPQVCTNLAVLAAIQMDEKPFRAMPCDGIVGLGLAALTTGPTSSLLGQLFKTSEKVLPQYGIAFGEDQGELHLGGHGLARLAAPLHWFPVEHPESGFWQVAIRSVRVGNYTVDSCHKGCHGIIDTGVSRLGVQKNRLAQLKSKLISRKSRGQCVGPDLTFVLGGMDLTLTPSDYTGSDCTTQVGSLDLEEPEFVGTYALGGAVLRSYYAAFDWEQHKLGFAPLVRASSASSHRGQPIPDEMAGVLMV